MLGGCKELAGGRQPRNMEAAQRPRRWLHVREAT